MKIQSFLQTPFVSHDELNMSYITVCDWDNCNPYEVTVFNGDEQIFYERIFAHEISAMLPCYSDSTVITVRITPFEDTPIERDYVLNPVKELKIPFVSSSHEDLGYCSYIEKLHRECYEYLVRAIELCYKFKDYCYMIEHIWWLDAFETYATEVEKNTLCNLIKSGRIEVNSIHSGIHTSWQESEMLVRSMYFGTREIEQKYGVRPQCALYTDISGITKSAITAHVNMGIKYMGVFFNDFRNTTPSQELPPIFWWKNADSGDRVLFWWQRGYRPPELKDIWCDRKRQYSDGEFYMDESRLYKTEQWLSKELHKFGELPYDIFPICFYDDRELPTDMILIACRELNRRWKYPKFSMGTPSQFLSDIEKRFGNRIPTFEGDIADQWADFATIAPTLTAKRRKLARDLYDAELLTAVSVAKNGTDYGRAAFRRSVWNAVSFDEHCWATSSKHPQSMHRHNIDAVKRIPVESSLTELQSIIASRIGEPTNSRMSVINTNPGARRKGLMILSGSSVPKGMSHQILPSGECLTEPIDFNGAEIQVFDTEIPNSFSHEIYTDTFETPYYNVRINRVSKKLDSIVHKTSGRELLDKDAEFEVGEFIYTYSENKLGQPVSIEVPKKRNLNVYEGDVAYIVISYGYEEQSAAEVCARFIFYKAEPRIDIKLTYKGATGLIGDFNDRYKKNYFFALPFKLESPKFYTELAAGELCENDKRIMGVSDFTVTQGAICAQNDERGIIIYSQDMPVFHLGSIKYNRFGSSFDENKAHFYLYASSNRSNNLIYKTPDKCSAEYELSVITYVGERCDLMSRFSNECQRKLLIGGVLSEEKLLSLVGNGTRLVSLKLSEDSADALVARFVETEGKCSHGVLHVPFTVTRATVTTNSEREVYDISVYGRAVEFDIQPYSYLTIKLFLK